METVGADAVAVAADAALAAEARAAEREPRSESRVHRAHEMTKNEMREFWKRREISPHFPTRSM